jgi:ribosomal-protein-alanine N-acetyltransferase
LTQEEAEAIAEWRYPAPYSFYDWTADADDLRELLEPELRGDAYWAVKDGDELVGYFSCKAKEDAVEIGLGLRPDLTGRGLGAEFLAAGLEFARTRFAPERFTLAVATFNERAIKVYERAGFRETGRHVRTFARWGDVQFVEMDEQR